MKGGFLDSKQIKNVRLFKPKDPYPPYFSMEINGTKIFVNYSSDLENWFSISNIEFSTIRDDLVAEVESLPKCKPDRFLDIDNVPPPPSTHLSEPEKIGGGYKS